jgi:flagellar hook-length control protein FliK
MPSGPAVRGPSTGGAPDTGGAESAAPFASALDGALSEGRDQVDEGATGEGRSEAGAATHPVVPVDAAAATATPVVDLAATLFAFALGTSQSTGPAADGDAPTGGTAVPAVLQAGSVTGAAGAVPEPALPAPGTAPAATLTGASPVLPGGTAPASPAGLPLDVVTGPGTAASAARAAPGTAVPSTDVLPAVGPAGVVAEVAPTAAAAASATGATAAPVPTGDAIASPATSPAAGADLPVVGTASPPGADTGATGQDAGGAPSGDGSAEPVTGGVSGPAPTGPAAATADADSATGAAASQPVSAQVARQVAVLRGAPDGSHTMTLVLTPETLGPVEVSVTVTQGTVDLVLRGAHEQSRAALLDALPDLRRDLESAGLITSKLEVSKDSGGSWLDRHAAGQQAQQGFGERPGQRGPADGRSRPWLRPADSGETRTIPTTGAASSGLDVRA